MFPGLCDIWSTCDVSRVGNGSRHLDTPIFDKHNFRHPTGSIQRHARAPGALNWTSRVSKIGFCRKWGCRGVGALLSVPIRHLIFDKPHFRHPTGWFSAMRHSRPETINSTSRVSKMEMSVEATWPVSNSGCKFHKAMCWGLFLFFLAISPNALWRRGRTRDFGIDRNITESIVILRNRS